MHFRGILSLCAREKFQFVDCQLNTVVKDRSKKFDLRF